ncbi:hypothetical protein [Alicycliphilus denitrificans]|uniref:hypothetical protein n=1 Tax=Alicycliphilus denitrificans TaxID=179636 RepID=UPI000C9FF586|nr:hypothetical protein [Alicycliphilus denitrificans]
MQLNRAQRRAARRAKPPPYGAGHITLPITIRFGASEETALMQQPIVAAQRLHDGTGNEGDWHAVTLRLNWARLLNKANFENGEAYFAEAQDAMRAVKSRAERYGTWSMSTPEHECTNQALVLCNQMQTMCTRRELRASLEAVYQANEYQAKVRAIQDRMDGRAGA